MSVSSGTSSNDISSSDDQYISAFHKLVKDLSHVLGPSSGLDSAEVDPEEIQKVMRFYKSNEKQWQHYALGDSSRTYTRNLVDRGNGKSDLVRHLQLKLVGRRANLKKVDPCMVARKRKPDS